MGPLHQVHPDMPSPHRRARRESKVEVKDGAAIPRCESCRSRRSRARDRRQKFRKPEKLVLCKKE